MKKKLWEKKQKEYKPDPIFGDLPEELKDPACFKKISKQILAVSKTEHEHKSISTWKRCKPCQLKFEDKRRLIKKLGFKSYSQFLAWRKVMDIIINKREIRIPNK